MRQHDMMPLDLARDAETFAPLERAYRARIVAEVEVCAHRLWWVWRRAQVVLPVEGLPELVAAFWQAPRKRWTNKRV
jgi:hypothetical protein